MKMKLDLDGRKVIKNEILEQTPTKIVVRTTFDDGTILTVYQDAHKIDVECNRDLVVQSDGKTVKIV